MKFLLNYILYLYLFLPSSAVSENRAELQTITTLDLYDTSSATSESTAVLSIQDGEKRNKESVLLKMLVITNNKNGSDCNCAATKHTQITTTEKIRTLLGFKVVMRNKPEKYSVNNSISRLCPYFVPNEGFKMYKMAAVYWAKFYNLKENLNCFKIQVLRLSPTEMEENELKFGSFGGKVDWTQCHFEIKPPELFLRRRHFLMGGINDNGVMRNIMVSYNPNGGFTMEEETPDQWLMLRNLVVLRDCWTGEVVVFTKFPQETTTEGIVQVLRSIGEEMVGKILCDEDDD